jgi:hypothetical protein
MEALLKGSAIETTKHEAEIEFPDRNPDVSRLGIHPQLAALETLVYPQSSHLIENSHLAESSTLEILPVESPLVIFG